ncbi:hypothetical protein D3C87_587930 [compost metagenome]
MTTTINVPANGAMPAAEFRKHPRIASMSYYYSNSDAELYKYLNTLVDPNEKIYVGFNSGGKARYGTIGVARPKHFPKDRSKWPTSPKFVSRSDIYDYIYEIAIDFDDGREIKAASPYSDELHWLKDYSGPTNWVFTRKAKEDTPPVVVLDRLGNELKTGDFIAYVGREPYTTGMGDLFFGFVEKISPKGVVYAKNIKLDDDDKQQTIRLGYPERATKLNKEIIDQLMIRRLTF